MFNVVNINILLLFFINIIWIATKKTVLDWWLNNIIIFITPTTFENINKIRNTYIINMLIRYCSINLPIRFFLHIFYFLFYYKSLFDSTFAKSEIYIIIYFAPLLLKVKFILSYIWLYLF